MPIHFPYSATLLSSIDVPLPDVNEVSFNGGGRGHGRADEMRAAAFSLPAFEIAIRSAGGPFAAR